MAERHDVSSRVRRKFPLKVRTLIMMLSMLFFFGLLFMATYMIVIDSAAKENEKASSEAAINDAFASIQLSLDSYNSMSRLIMLNSDVVDFVHNEPDCTFQKFSSGIFGITNQYSNVDSVYLFRTDGVSEHCGQGVMTVDRELMQTEEWLKPIIDARGGNVISIDCGGAMKKRNGKRIITMSRVMYDLTTQEQLALLIINIDSYALATALENLQVGESICVLDSEGGYLYGDKGLQEYYVSNAENDSLKTEVQLGGKRRTVIQSRKNLPLTVIYLTREAGVLTGVFSAEIMIALLVLVVAFVLMVLITGAFITINVNLPIERLMHAMESTKSSGWLEHIDAELPNDEFGKLAVSYNSMIDHLNSMFDQLMEKEKNVRKAEMRVLTEQIKPHFLYNSLETIGYMALEAQASKVHDAIETLGSFYRNFLSKGDREIPLKREISITQNYLALQKLRYGEAFDAAYDISPDVMDVMIPKLILQPLVENSIYHGVRLKGEKGLIKISAFKDKDGVHIVVYDTGVGMSQEQIERVINPTESDCSRVSGFGLCGTIDRIRYYCGGRDAVKISSSEGEFTRIEIVINEETLLGSSGSR